MTPENNKPQMMTIPQLAALGYLPQRAIRRFVKEGTLPSVKSGNRPYINVDVFKRFVQGERVNERGA
jgi:hypothetical protein